MPLFNALGIGASLLGGIMGNRAENRARRAQEQATREAVGYQREAMQGYQPYQQAGTQGLNQLGTLMAGDYSGFMNSPDYLAAQEMGMKALDRNAAARGRLYSGGADADRIRLGQQLATQNLGNYRNALFGMTNIGQNAQNSVAGLYGNMGNLAIGRGAAQAQSAQNVGANNLNTLNNIWGFGADWLGGKGKG